jgi:hypothetical protein
MDWGQGRVHQSFLEQQRAAENAAAAAAAVPIGWAIPHAPLLPPPNPMLRQFGLRVWVVELEVLLADLVLFRRQVRFVEETALVQPGQVLVVTRLARFNWLSARPPPGQQGWQWLTPIELDQLREQQAPQYRPGSIENLDARHQYAESESDRTDIDGEPHDS